MHTYINNLVEHTKNLFYNRSKTELCIFPCSQIYDYLNVLNIYTWVAFSILKIYIRMR